MSSAAASVFVDNTQLSENVVRCRVEFGIRFRLREGQREHSKQVKLISSRETQRTVNRRFRFASVTRFIGVVVVRLKDEVLAKRRARVERAERMFNERKLPNAGAGPHAF